MEEKKEHISEYARRMRELAGLSEGNQKKSLKTIQEGENSFEDGATFMAKDLMGESKEELENPEKADLDKDGEISDYEEKRGKAVEKAMKKKSVNESDEDLENPEKADLNKDGKLSSYEKKRGKAVEKAMKKESINESEEKGEFETYKFEQKTIEEGDNDQELYSLNENTIIVLDFMDDEEDK